MSKTLITRFDDIGGTISANQSAKTAYKHSFIKNYSILAVGDQVENAAHQLAGNKDMVFGLHFSINAEWDNFRWRPRGKQNTSFCLPDGSLSQSPLFFKRTHIDLNEVVAEFIAQYEYLISMGFTIRYADSHMLPELMIEGLQPRLSEVIKQLGLIDHMYYYNTIPGASNFPKDAKAFESALAQAKDGTQHVVIYHPAKLSEEMKLMGNARFKGEDIANTRNGDYLFVTAPQTLEICKKYMVQPISYCEAVPGELPNLKDSIGFL